MELWVLALALVLVPFVGLVPALVLVLVPALALVVRVVLVLVPLMRGVVRVLEVEQHSLARGAPMKTSL